MNRKPHIHRRTLQEMIAGYTMVVKEYGACPKCLIELDGARDYLRHCFPDSDPHVAADMEALLVKVTITNCQGERMTFEEPAADFPSDTLIAQLMLVT